MKRTVFGAIITILSVGIGPAMANDVAEVRIDIRDIPALTFNEQGGIDLPGLKLVGPSIEKKISAKLKSATAPHEPFQNCCGTYLTREEDAIRHNVPTVQPPNRAVELTVPRIDISEDIRSDILDDLRDLQRGIEGIGSGGGGGGGGGEESEDLEEPNNNEDEDSSLPDDDPEDIDNDGDDDEEE